MNSLAFIVTLPINILIIYAIIDDIREIIREKEQQRIREANLLRDTIHIDLSYEALEMLDMNVKRSNCNTRAEYIREQIKKLNQDA